MIGVLADDLTGAAEIGGAGWRHGLNAEIHTQPCSTGGNALVIEDTDSRECSPSEAAYRAGTAAAGLVAGQHEWIYKKIDSVLRGPVLAEIEAVLGALALKRALMLPANPSQGRVVRIGRYFVQGRPIDETDFLNDPVYPRQTADVLALVGSGVSLPVYLCQPGDALPTRGIVIGEVESADDLRCWAAQVDDEVLCVGGADFFRALLEKDGWKPDPHLRLTPASSDTKSVFVCGTASSGKTTLMRTAAARGVPVLPLPLELFSGVGDSTSRFEEWSRRILASLADASSVVLVIDQPPLQNAEHARQAGDFLLKGALRTLGAAVALRFLVEGGSTASELLRRLGWKRLQVEGELAPGVVCLTEASSRDLRFIVKPGSYTWPAAAWPAD